MSVTAESLYESLTSLSVDTKRIILYNNLHMFPSIQQLFILADLNEVIKAAPRTDLYKESMLSIIKLYVEEITA